MGIPSSIKNRCLGAVLRELERAEGLYPNWPDNLVEATAIVTEEAGEALKEALNLRDCERPGRGSIERLKKELTQTGAMALRALENLEARG